jgi:hypothetical protein
MICRDLPRRRAPRRSSPRPDAAPAAAASCSWTEPPAPLASTGAVDIDGAPGQDDRLTVDSCAGLCLPSQDLDFDGYDTLEVRGSRFRSVAVHQTGPDSGSILFGAGVPPPACASATSSPSRSTAASGSPPTPRSTSRPRRSTSTTASAPSASAPSSLPPGKHLLVSNATVQATDGSIRLTANDAEVPATGDFKGPGSPVQKTLVSRTSTEPSSRRVAST